MTNPRHRTGFRDRGHSHRRVNTLASRRVIPPSIEIWGKRRPPYVSERQPLDAKRGSLPQLWAFSFFEDLTVRLLDVGVGEDTGRGRRKRGGGGHAEVMQYFRGPVELVCFIKWGDTAIACVDWPGMCSGCSLIPAQTWNDERRNWSRQLPCRHSACQKPVSLVFFFFIALPGR